MQKKTGEFISRTSIFSISFQPATRPRFFVSARECCDRTQNYLTSIKSLSINNITFVRDYRQLIVSDSNNKHCHQNFVVSSVVSMRQISASTVERVENVIISIVIASENFEFIQSENFVIGSHFISTET